MNIPDTELKETIKEIGIATYGGVDFEPTGMYRDKLTVILNNLLTSRDTYWKERVGKEVKAERERILKACDVNSFLRDEDHEDFVVYLTDIETITKATPITNEDNLK